MIKKIHGVVINGKKAQPTSYRKEQNSIRNAGTGRIVYLPPEAKDVPGLMSSMVRWIKNAEKKDVPAPIIAALAHYQFVTIHPYYDGNGRTARLLATFILQKRGYGLNGFFSLEEFHAENISKYYETLSTHKHYNYYEGRAEADLTSWVEYFVILLMNVFKNVYKQTLVYIKKGFKPEPEILRKMDIRARHVFNLFIDKETTTTAEMAGILGLSQRMVRNLVKKWTNQGILKAIGKSKKSRAYELTEIYRKFIGNKKT